MAPPGPLQTQQSSTDPVVQQSLPPEQSFAICPSDVQVLHVPLMHMSAELLQQFDWLQS